MRLQASRSFGRSASQVRLLRFLVERGDADAASLRESQIGESFYGRQAGYDPRDDSIVRVNVNRLRQRLQDYYEGEGATNPVRIAIPRGSYLPVVTLLEGIEVARPQEPAIAAPEPQEDVTVEPTAQVPPPVQQQDEPIQSAAQPAATGRSRRSLLFAGVLVLLTAAAGIAASLIFHARTPPFLTERLTPVPLTSGKSMEFEPAASRDGKRLAYVRQDRGTHSFHIWLRDEGGSEAEDRLLNTGPESAFYPAWSPDGTRLAFLRCGHRPCEVATIAAVGGAVTPVRTLPRYTVPDDQPYYQYRQLTPTWTADGSSLIYPYRGDSDPAELLVQQNLQTGKTDVLLEGAPGDEDGAPAVSPDGRRLAFLRRHLTTTAVTILKLDDRSTQVLQTEPNVTSSGLSWAPDNSGIIVGMNEQKGLLLRWLPLHGAPRELPGSMLPFMNPAFGPGNRSLMVLNVNRTRNLAAVSGRNGTPAPVFRSKQRNYSTTFSPDGTELAFLTDRSGRVEVWKASRQGTDFAEPTQLTHGLTWFPSSLVWSPDGSTLAAGVANSNIVDLVDTHSGQIRKLNVPGLERSVLWSPCWSADSRYIFASAAGEQNGIFQIATAGDPAVHQIMFGNAREVRVDGDRALYFTPAFGQGIQKLNLQPGAAPQAVPALSGVLPSRAWVVRDGRLYYLDVWDDERRLHSYDLATGVQGIVSGPLSRPVFADSSIAYLPEQQLLLFSEWAEAAGSQIFILHW